MKGILDRIFNHRYSFFFTAGLCVLAVLVNDKVIRLAVPLTDPVVRYWEQKPYLDRHARLSGGEGPVVFHHGFKHLSLEKGLAFRRISLKPRFSIEFVVNPSRDNPDLAHILGNHPGHFQGFAVERMIGEPGVYLFGFGNGKTWLPIVRFRLVPDEWNYVAILVDGGMLKVFHNGVFAAEINAGDEIENSHLPLWVGNWINRDRPFKGFVDEVRVSNGLVPESDIASNWDRVRKGLE